MFSKRSVFSTIGLGALVCFTSWISLKNTSMNPAQAPTGRYQTGIATGATISKFAANGQVKYNAITKQISQYNDDSANLQKLQVEYFDQANQPPWHLHANSGIASKGSKWVTLNGNVHIFRSGYQQNPPLQMQTQSLTLYPQTHTITSNKPVQFSEPGSNNKTSGIGMYANLQTHEIKLLSKVSSTYEITHQ